MSESEKTMLEAMSQTAQAEFLEKGFRGVSLRNPADCLRQFLNYG